MDEQRLRRIFDVVEYLGRHDGATVTDVSRDLDVPLSSAHDLLKALTQIDAVTEANKRYALGPLALRLAFGLAEGDRVQRVAQIHLERLARESQRDAYLAVRCGTKVVYASRHPGSQAVNIDIPLGQPLYLHSTAVGKLFAALDREMYRALVAARRPVLTDRTRTTLSSLDRDLRVIRARGLAISRGESVPGIVGMAAPVWDPGGRLVAAVHLSVLLGSMAPAELKEHCESVRRAAEAIELDLSAKSARIA